MNNYVFKIRFNESQFDLNDQYESLSDLDREKIEEMDAISYFDYSDYDDKYVCFIIANKLEMEKYLEILSRNYIKFDCVDLSDDILKFKIDLTEELRPLLSTTNSIKYSFFLDDLDDWILENLEIDTVLDRISEIGIDNLSSVEKEFLKNFQLP
jgi:hypothetical protein